MHTLALFPQLPKPPKPRPLKAAGRFVHKSAPIAPLLQVPSVAFCLFRAG